MKRKTNNYFALFYFILQFFLFEIANGVTPSVKNGQQCFDVLNGLPQKEIEKIYFMKFPTVAQTHPASDILRCFLRASHPGDKSETEQYFDVYNKCEEYKRRKNEPFGKQQLEELVSLGLPYDLENYLRDKLKTGNKIVLEQAIQHVQDVMSKNVELSREYKEYKVLIAKKYKPNEAKQVSPTSTGKSLTSTKVDSRNTFLKFLSGAIFVD